jgi:hypothetical protein
MTKATSPKPEPRVFKASVQPTIERTLSVYPVTDKLSAVKLVTTTTYPKTKKTLGFEEHTVSIEEQFFAKASNVRSFVNGKVSAMTKLEFKLAGQATFDYLAKNGWFRDDAGYALVNEDLPAYDSFVAGTADTPQMIRYDFSSNLAFNVDEELVPVGLHFSYLDGRMHDGVYDLKKAAACLLKNKQVRFTKSLKMADEAIEEVPHYNQSRGCSTCLTPFIFTPTHKQMQEMSDKAKSYPTAYFCTQLRRAIFDLDMLGLRKAGAAKHTDFWQSDDED